MENLTTMEVIIYIAGIGIIFIIAIILKLLLSHKGMVS